MEISIFKIEDISFKRAGENHSVLIRYFLWCTFHKILKVETEEMLRNYVEGYKVKASIW